MSESDNVERFWALTRHWQEHRALPLEALTDDVEWVNPPVAVEPGTRQGAASFNDAIASIYEGWKESRFQPAEVLASGDDVVALGELQVRGRAVGFEVRREHAQVWTFRDGRVARMRWFDNHAQALEAAGLAE